MDGSIKITSYNSHGHGCGRLEYIQKLLDKCEFLLWQEHWYHAKELLAVPNKLKNVFLHGCSGMDDTRLLNGRPFGGCAILWKNNSEFKVTPLEIKHNRICAIKIETLTQSILLVNVYMPCDTMCGNYNNIEFFDAISNIKTIITATDCNKIIVGGDFNCNFLNTSANVNMLKSFLMEESLVEFSDTKEIDYTFESKVDQHRSVIDHIFVSENLLCKNSKYFVTHEGDNLSDHSPITLTLVIESAQPNTRVMRDIIVNDKVLWNKCDDTMLSNYKNELTLKLNHMYIPWDVLQCKKVNCNDKNHSSMILGLYESVIQCCVQAASETLPMTSNSSKTKNSKPGWNQFVKRAKETSCFWHKLWKENGSPRFGHIAEIRRSTRAKYHQAIKYIKKKEQMLRNSNIADTLVNNKTKDFWSIIHKMTNNKSNNLPSNIEGHTSDDDISNYFANKYDLLYHSVGYDTNEFTSFIHSLDNDISNLCCKDQCVKHDINVSDVISAINRLKSGKHEGLNNLYSDHLKNGTSQLYIYLALIFSALITHCALPEDMLMSTLIPLIKNKRKSASCGDNYRAIALSSVLGKLLDNIMLNKFSNILCSSDLQFGFKQNHSTVSCSFVVNEVIQYYKNQNTPVNVCLLDASKAFDRVPKLLFKILHEKHLCPLYIKYMALLYTHQLAHVKYNNSRSACFQLHNGVKQGGVLSPVLFTIYMDKLLEKT